MNEEGYHLHPIDICNRLLNFIRKKLPTFSLKPVALGCFGLLICHKLINATKQILASHAIKPVTLGCPTTGASCPLGKFGHLEAAREPSQVQESGDAEKRVEEKVGIQAGAAKKAESINHNVEEIITRKKRERKKMATEKLEERKKMATEKLSSMEKEKEKERERSKNHEVSSDGRSSNE